MTTWFGTHAQGDIGTFDHAVAPFGRAWICARSHPARGGPGRDGLLYGASVTEPTRDLAPNAHRFAPLTPEQAGRWSKFPDADRVIFPVFIGLEVEEIRTDYARMRLPYRPDFEQPAGVVHGGAIATLIDTVVVPAVGSAYDVPVAMLTLSMTLNFIGAVVGEDTVAEGWIERRGRATVFCRAEARTAKRGLVTSASLVYTVRPIAGS